MCYNVISEIKSSHEMVYTCCMNLEPGLMLKNGGKLFYSKLEIQF